MSSPVLPKKRYGKALAQTSLRLWKLVRDEGGWWTVSELALSLRWPDDRVRMCARNLLRHQYLVLRVQPVTGLRRVGVTAFCYPPKGEFLEPGSNPAADDLCGA